MENALPTTAPVVLTPILVDRIWGVTSLAPWHAGGTADRHIGEVWLTAEECVAETGAAAGTTLAELTAASPANFGDRERKGFPLLMKLLFPREKLSVQVHPNDIQAQALGMPRGKTECWYVLEAQPGAELALAFREPLNGEQISAAIEDGSLEGKLRWISVKAGDMIFVEAGTVHAMGPGMVVLETQQYSDTTYRLWDYGRPRELHVAAGTAVARADSRAGLVEPKPMDGYTRLVSCEYFIVDRFDLEHGSQMPLGHAHDLQILFALDNGCAVLSQSGVATRLPFGQAMVLPASGTGYTLVSENPRAAVIRVRKP